MDATKLDIQNSGNGADKQCFGQAGHTDQQTMAAGENCSQDLINDRVLPDDHLVQLFHHDIVVLAQLFKEIVEIFLLSHADWSFGCQLSRR